MLTREQAIAFYNRVGSRQDRQALRKTPATSDLIAHLSFDTARSVFEFGCGTGLTLIKQRGKAFWSRHAITLFHQVSHLFPINLHIEPDAHPPVMANISISAFSAFLLYLKRDVSLRKAVKRLESA